MRKKFLFILSAFMLSTSIYAAREIIPLSAKNDNLKPIGNGYPKSPVQVPTVYIEDYTLTFEAYHPDYILYIKDEDGDVVFTTTVYSAQTQVVLPSTLSGDYEVELVMGNWLFTGWINL